MTAPAFTPTPHLDHLDVEVARLAGLAREARDPVPAAVVEAATERTIVATLRLDGSPIEALPEGLPDTVGGAVTGDVAGHLDSEVAAPRPSDERDASHTGAANGHAGAASGHTGAANGRAKAGSWYASLALLEDAPDEAIVRLEAAGALRAHTSDDLATSLADDPSAALTELHRRLTVGLLDVATAGRPRTTDQAVHDASIGRLLYHTVHPDHIGEELERLTTWMGGPATDLHPLHAAGLVHLEILRIHPFEAANGRLARAAARLWLRRGGLDPHGLAVAETTLFDDRLGYHEEVASTLRRRDAGIWLERWGEAVAAGLRQHLREAGWLATDLPDRAGAFVREQGPGEAFTIADYRAHVGDDPGAADEDLHRLLDAGAVTRVPGGRGLRFLVVTSVA